MILSSYADYVYIMVVTLMVFIRTTGHYMGSMPQHKLFSRVEVPHFVTNHSRRYQPDRGTYPRRYHYHKPDHIPHPPRLKQRALAPC